MKADFVLIFTNRDKNRDVNFMDYPGGDVHILEVVPPANIPQPVESQRNAYYGAIWMARCLLSSSDDRAAIGVSDGWFRLKATEDGFNRLFKIIDA